MLHSSPPRGTAPQLVIKSLVALDENLDLTPAVKLTTFQYSISAS